MQIDAPKIQKIISEASSVVIMAHKNLDLDALGSSLGMYYLSKSLGKTTHLLIEEEHHEMGVARSLKELKIRNLNISIKSLSELKMFIDNRTLLIVLDVHIPEITQNKEVFNFVKNIIIIDHHVQDKEFVEDIKYKYVESSLSSTSEVVIEVLKDSNNYIPSYVATVMLAGIVIDTNRFAQKTTSRTHDSASYLYAAGADSKELQYLLKEDLDRYNKRQEIIAGVSLVNSSFAVGMGPDVYVYYTEDLAKVSDTLLWCEAVEASYTIAKIEENVVGISARSLGNIDVQKIMERLGGGGHITDAATQLRGISIEEAREKLIETLKKV